MKKKLTAIQAISRLQDAIWKKDRAKMLDLIAPDDPDYLPDWDLELNYHWEEWDNLVDKAKEILGV
jgi:hypothetical protein